MRTDSAEVVTVAFRTLGCKVNRAESERIAAELLGRGARLVAEDDAAVVIVNSCTVTGEADAKGRKAIRHALKAAHRPIVVVTGCLAAMDPPALQALDDRVIVEADKERVPARVAEVLGLRADGRAAIERRPGDGFRTRALVKIQDGCDAYCSYCIVPYARGVPRSLPLDSILEECGTLMERGVREVVLTGINLGRFRDGDRRLADLVGAVARTGISRVRLSSIEPPDLDDHLLQALAEAPAVTPHLHVPLQSGSDAVLAAMGRSYTLEQYERRVARARAVIAGLTLTTDVIAGFPGETDEQAAETLAACEHLGFSKLHVFRYSERSGTPAATLPQLAPEVRARRASALRALGVRMRSEYVEQRLGRLAGVLVEERFADGAFGGTTTDYLRVRVACGPDVAIGDIVEVRLTGLEGTLVRGERV